MKEKKIEFTSDCPCTFIFTKDGVFSSNDIPISSIKFTDEKDIQKHEVLCGSQADSQYLKGGRIEKISAKGNIVITGSTTGHTIINGSEIMMGEKETGYQHLWDKSIDTKLNKLMLSGTSSADVEMPVTSNFIFQGSGNTKAFFRNITFNVLSTFNISGNSRIDFFGCKADRAHFSISGNSNIEGRKSFFNIASLFISGNGKMNIENTKIL